MASINASPELLGKFLLDVGIPTGSFRFSPEGHRTGLVGFGGESPDSLSKTKEYNETLYYYVWKEEDVWVIGSDVLEDGGKRLFYPPNRDYFKEEYRVIPLVQLGVSEEKFSELKERIKKEEVRLLQEEVAGLRSKIEEVLQADFFVALSKRLREQLGRFLPPEKPIFSPPPSSQPKVSIEIEPEELARSIEDLTRLIEWVRSEEEEATALIESIGGRHLIVSDYTVWHRNGSGSTNLGDGWVIRSDGSLRERNTDDVPKHKQDGNYLWYLVRPDELAISWKKRYSASPHEFQINHLPVAGCTPEQLATVSRLEEEAYAKHGLSNPDEPMIGWALYKKVELQEEPEDPPADESLEDALLRLKSHFGK